MAGTQLQSREIEIENEINFFSLENFTKKSQITNTWDFIFGGIIYDFKIAKRKIRSNSIEAQHTCNAIRSNAKDFDS